MTRYPTAQMPLPAPLGALPASGPTAYPSASPATLAHSPVPPHLLGVFHSPGHKVAAICVAVLFFFRFSMAAEMLTAFFGVPSFALFILYPLGVAGVFLSGGLSRVWQGPARYWLVFLIWLAVTTMFSSWISGSLELVSQFAKGAVMMLVLSIGGLLSWRECRRCLSAMAAGCIIILYVGTKFNAEIGGRLAIGFGTIGNSNDLAAHLLLCFPVLMYVTLSSSYRFVWRMAALPLLGWSIYVILGSGSRGALVSLIVMGALFIVLSPGRLRLAVVLLLMLSFAAIPLLPANVINRLSSLFVTDNTLEAKEANESSTHRQQQLRNGLIFVRDRPLFGVGPAQFSNFNGNYGNETGERTYWRNAHNSYLNTAAETGVPGFIMYMMAIVGTGLLFWRTHSMTKKLKPLADISLASLCLLMGFVGFCIAIFFLNFTYLFHAPTMTGLAVALHGATLWEIRRLSEQQNAGMPPMASSPARMAAFPQPVSVPVGPGPDSVAEAWIPGRRLSPRSSQFTPPQ